MHSCAMLRTVTHNRREGLKSPEDVRAELERRGIPVARAAKDLGVSPRVVYDLLKGRLRGRYGDAYRAAVLLGLKDGVVE